MSRCVEKIVHKACGKNGLQVFQKEGGGYDGWCFICNKYEANPYEDQPPDYKPAFQQKSPEEIQNELDEVGEFHKKLVDWNIPKDMNGNEFKIESLTTFSKNLTKDKIVLQVMNDLNDRSRVGIEKYNTTLERTDLELKDWLQHLLEELMDATLYLKRIQNHYNH